MKRTRAERREQLDRLRAARNAEIDRLMMVYFFAKGLDPTRKPGVDVVELILVEEYGPAEVPAKAGPAGVTGDPAVTSPSSARPSSRPGPA
ncbi:hypothetical protein [Limnoglobus roseus]|uniref:Uncharacterized protein n=1 Tax=Limnoglobus roseus TaxID=2598579 RepID=A0A5C1AQS5_9BACT|nr:hypothetical protein [Limnoglobus roseus]QEL20547.1 hypothetical protein PX52LOC_07652 [Limnoglobus roseus]